MEELTPPTHKPAWLIKLEEESWQAELLISGVAVFGTLQLPGLIDMFEEYVLYTVNRESLAFWAIIGVYFRMLAYILISTFVIHFALRALWIGMLGFNSVYPGGFKPNEMYSEDYRAKLMDEFGDVNGYIRKLDRRCSSTFGMGFAVSLLFFGLGAFLVGIGMILYLTRDYLPSNFYFLFGGILYVLIMVLAGVSFVMMRPKNHD
ncbi:MAG: hypothetical protein AAFU67_12275, partial [Bacteroidota bacterium]